MKMMPLLAMLMQMLVQKVREDTDLTTCFASLDLKCFFFPIKSALPQNMDEMRQGYQQTQKSA